MIDIQFSNSTIGRDRSVYIIAEPACAHEGDFDYAAGLVDAAAAAGVSAVKFQVFSADGLVVPTHDLHAAYVKFQFSLGQWTQLARRARAGGLDVWIDVFEPWSLEVADQCRADGVKVHSTNVTNPFLLRRVAKVGRPVLIGTGGTARTEIAEAVAIIREAGTPLALIHGFQGYPTAPADTHLRRLTSLAKDFDALVGFAGHAAAGSDGMVAQSIMAVGLGACILENHLILEQSDTRTDHHSAMLPEQLTALVTAIRGIETAAGSPSYELGEAELKYRATFKSFIVAAEDLKQGHELTVRDLAFKRADGGLLPARADRILGRRLAVDVDADTPLTEELLAPENERT